MKFGRRSCFRWNEVCMPGDSDGNQSDSGCIPCGAAWSLCGRGLPRVMLAMVLLGAETVAGQSSPPQPDGQTQTAKAKSAASPAQVVPPVTTTVIVHGDVKDNYL